MGLQNLWRSFREPGEDSKYVLLVENGEYGGFDIRRRYALRSIARIILTLVGLVAFVAGVLTYGTTAYQKSIAGADGKPYQYDNKLIDHLYDIDAGSRRFAVVVFGSEPGPTLCKVVMSAIAMGYPMPVVVNLEARIGEYFPQYMQSSHPNHIGPNLLKIPSALAYLDEISHSSAHGDDKLGPDDLVLMVDADDVWFQTPPSVLIRRYHEQNREAKDRLLKMWPARKSDMPMYQDIIISSQKKCYPLPATGYELQCEKLPDSPLRDDLYGADTDPHSAVVEKTVEEHRRTRPKYINSGAMMGTVSSLRKFLRKSKERMDEKAVNSPHDLQSDQGMLGEIWGGQEIWRTWQRQNAGNWNQFSELFMQQRDSEYGVGLDYKRDICIATVFGEQDGDILELNDKPAIDKASRQLSIKTTRLRGVPADLKASQSPLSILPEFENKNVTDWGALPMYADFFTGTVPVMVHHNARQQGLEHRNVLWWDRMWFFPYLRDLVTARLERPSNQPLAEVTARNGRKTTYYPVQGDATKRLPRIFKQGMGKAGLTEATWDQLCASPGMTTHWSEDVFRDGKGALSVKKPGTPKAKPSKDNAEQQDMGSPVIPRIREDAAQEEK